MRIFLTVVQPFGGYAKGDLIEDQEKVAAIRAGENAFHVVATEQAEPEPAAEAEAEPQAETDPLADPAKAEEKPDSFRRRTGR